MFCTFGVFFTHHILLLYYYVRNKQYYFTCVVTLQGLIFLHFLWLGPLEAVVVLYLLWQYVGPASLAGFSFLILLIPVQGSMGKIFSSFRWVHACERVHCEHVHCVCMSVARMLIMSICVHCVTFCACILSMCIVSMFQGSQVSLISLNPIEF